MDTIREKEILNNLYMNNKAHGNLGMQMHPLDVDGTLIDSSPGLYKSHKSLNFGLNMSMKIILKKI